MPDLLSRRALLVSLGTLGALFGRPLRGSLAAQAGPPPIRVRTINHFGIAVSDPKRSIDFYQGLFGMPVQARIGPTTVLRVGAGPQSLVIRGPLEIDATPAFTHFGLGVEGFSIDGILTALAGQSVTKAADIGRLKATVTVRDGCSELRFGDPDGVVCQLQDPSFCWGSGPLGNQCTTEPARRRGAIALSDMSHLTIGTTNVQESNRFYQALFGLPIRAYQGPTAPALAIGPATQFLMFAGGGSGRGAPPPALRRQINHACWSLDGFKPDVILKTLESFGLKPRESTQGPVGPLRHYVTMRMENRGGAPGGTPELYFTDPDGLLMQLQDTTYCGGGGFLGNECPMPKP